jgi:cell division protein FtsQ
LQSVINTSRFHVIPETSVQSSSIQGVSGVLSTAVNGGTGKRSLYQWFVAHSNAASRVGFVTCIIGYFLVFGVALSQTDQWGVLSNAASRLANNAAVGVGLEVKKVTVEGQVNLSDAEIAAALGTRAGVSIISFDTNTAREKLKQNGWIREARVMRLLPSTLVVELEEKAPYALWQEGGKIAVISKTGEVLTITTRSAFPDLPLVTGPGAAQPAREVVEALKPFPELKRHVRDIERIAGRRWDLVLDTGIRAKLPVMNIRQSLADLNKIAAESEAALYELAEIDFRVPSQFTVRLRDNTETGRKRFMAWLSKTREGGDSQL